MASNLLYVVYTENGPLSASHSIDTLEECLFKAGMDGLPIIGSESRKCNAGFLAGFETGDAEKQFTVCLWKIQDDIPDSNHMDTVWLEFVKRYEPETYERLSDFVTKCRDYIVGYNLTVKADTLWDKVKDTIMANVGHYTELYALSEKVSEEANKMMESEGETNGETE